MADLNKKMFLLRSKVLSFSRLSLQSRVPHTPQNRYPTFRKLPQEGFQLLPLCPL